jgi:hypothetical protein
MAAGEIFPHFIPTPAARAIMPALPLPDGSQTFRARREEGLSDLAVTCGEAWGEAVTSVAPPAFLAVARAGSPARGQAGFSRPPGRPRIRVSRKRNKRMDGGTGLWRRLRPVTGARCFVPETTETCFARGPCPGPLSEAVTACRMRDTIRRISGPRATCATLRMFRFIRGMHINPLPNGTACARPSGLFFAKLRRRHARRVFVRRSEAEPDHPFRRYSPSWPPYSRQTACCLRRLPLALASCCPAVAPVLQPKFPSGDPP